MEEQEILSFFNKDGTIKNKDEIVQQVEDIYDAIKEEEDLNKENSYFSKITNPETSIDTASSLETFDFMNRTLFLTEEITAETGPQFFEAIRFFNKCDEIDRIPVEERDPIKIIIDTPGGDLCATLSIIDSIKLSKTPVWTITTGCGYSGGFLLEFVVTKDLDFLIVHIYFTKELVVGHLMLINFNSKQNSMKRL